MFNIRVKTKDFLKSIIIVENAIEDDKLENSKNNGIFIETKNDKLEFRTAGFNLSIKCECEARVLSEGSIIIKHKLIEEFLRKVADEEIEIKQENNSITIFTDGSVTNYSLLDYEKPSELGEIEGITYKFDKKTLYENIENSKFAVSTDTAKTVINCMKFDVESDILKLVSTDSYRLVYKEMEMLENLTNENISINIPLKIIESLLKIFRESNTDEVLFKTEGTRVLFKLNDIEIITKVVEIQFPDYNSILKGVKTPKKVELSKVDFQKALERVQIFVKDKKERKDVAEFLFSNSELNISGQSEYGNTNSKLVIGSNFDDLKIYLNVKFILEYLNTLKNVQIIEIYMSDETSAILIKEQGVNKNNIYLTMPLKI